jgi:hypothetical protein
VHTPGDGGSLLAALDELSGLGGEGDQAALAALRRLERALQTAATAREATAGDAARLDGELAGRPQRLGRVLGQLDEATAGVTRLAGEG